jgi:N-acetylglutamate synthase-like GNAT family acetyltransferase
MKSLTRGKICIGASVMIGIGPDYQKKGLATALAKKLIRNLKAIGVRAIYTLVSWSDWDLLHRYFKKFEKSPGCLR